MAKTRTEKIDSLQTEIAQLESKRKRLIQEQKQQERKDRTKRLCRRMGLFESMLPHTIPLTDEQFKTFLEKTITTDQSRRILDGLTAQPITPPAAKPAETEQENGADEGEDEGTAQG